MPDIAGKVGPGDGGLENSKKDPIFNSQGVSRLAVVQPRDGTVIFQPQQQLAREGNQSPQGDGSGKRTRRDELIPC